MLVGAERSIGLVAVAEAAQVRREQGVALGEPRHDRLPGQPVFGPTMQQQERGPLAGARDMEGRAVSPNRQMLHRGCSFSFRGRPFGFLLARGLSGQPSSPRTRPDRRADSAPYWRLERWQSGRMHRTRNSVAIVSAGDDRFYRALFSLTDLVPPSIKSCFVSCAATRSGSGMVA